MRLLFAKTWASGAALIFIATTAVADDAYVVRFFTQRYITSTTECLSVGWWDQLTFRNVGSSDRTVRLLEASNGYVPPQDEVLNVPAGKTRSLFVFPIPQQGRHGNAWAPRDPYVFIVNRLAVPSDVLVESRGEVYGGGGDGGPLPCDPFRVGTTIFGSFSLPVVRSLTTPNSAQYHLASDLGTLTSRTNVGIYNGGAAQATATIEVRRGCDDALVETRTVSVPGNAVIQAGGFVNDYLQSGCTGFGSTPDHNRYVIVRVDQPSFSFITTIAQDLPPKIAVSATSAR